MADKSTTDFINDLTTSDQTSMVLKGHLHLEQSVVAFLKDVLPDFSAIEGRGYGFRRFVEIALACGLDKGIGKFALAINGVRNDFAHKLGTKLEKKTVLGIYNGLSKTNKKAVDAGYSSTLTKTKSNAPKKITQLKADELFLILIVSVRQGFEAARKQLP